MAEPLSVLIVEDSESDARLLVRNLERAGYDVAWERVETAGSMRSALEGRSWDLVIADYSMPKFSAPAALALLQESGLDLPFIIVSGSVGEDVAVEAMRAGAHDYLLKGKLKRLFPAIQRELEQAGERRARRTAEESIQKLSLAVEQAKNAIFMTDPDGAINYVNPAFEKIYGYSGEEALGKTPRILKSGRHDRAFYEEFWRRLLAGEAVSEEFVNRTHDGQLVTVETSVSPVLDARGKRLGFIAVQNDVTGRKRSEEALRESEKRFALAFQHTPVATSISESASGRIVTVNEQFLRMLGYEREQVIGRTSNELGIWSDPGDRERLVAVLDEAETASTEVRLRTRLGEIRDVVGSIVRVDLGNIPCALSTFLDITERKRAEEALQQSEERYRQLFERNLAGVFRSTLDGRLLECNDAFARVYGYSSSEEILTRPATELYSEPKLRDQLMTLIRKDGALVNYEEEGRRRDGSSVWVLGNYTIVPETRAGVTIVEGTLIDITERKQLEDQLRQAQKMEAIGQLAGGVAHDFNNLLTVILGYCDLLAAEVDEQGPLIEAVSEIRKAGERAATLTRQLLAFSRRQVLEPKVLEVNTLVSNLEKMLQRLIGEDVDLVTVLDPAVGRVHADAGQIEQVILNLAVNSRDAMTKGGKLTIETSNADLDEAYAREHVTVRPGRYVMLAVADTGTGMSAATKSHMFEPFFTTKGQGKGTGLGLATVYGIVKQSGGYVWVYSEPDRGTTFKVYLPRVDAIAEEKGVPAVKLSTRGTETILLVEDDQAVRALTRTLLEAKGYKVLEASGAQDAIAIVRSAEHPIDLLLTDVVMPEMGGSDLASRLVTLRPGLKVLYMSGYTDDAVVRHGLVAEGARFLQKPFTPDVLARKLREALDS